MEAQVRPMKQTGPDAVYEITLPRRGGTQALYFTVTPEGALGFDNRQPGAGRCAGRRNSRALAEAMVRTARQRVPGALEGRSVRGMALELRVHYRAWRLGVQRGHAVTTELGSPNPQAPDHDRNARWFEHPFRSMPQIFKALLP